MVISVAKTCSIIWRSYVIVLFNFVASALMALCFLSQAKQLGSWPYLCRESGKWSIQCHFLIMPTDGNALWKVAKDSSMMWRREALDVAPQQTPAWIWSIVSAIATKAWQASWQISLGTTMECKKCLMAGKTDKHSLAMQENLWFLLYLATLVAWNKLGRCWHLQACGNWKKLRYCSKHGHTCKPQAWMAFMVCHKTMGAVPCRIPCI